MNLLSSIKTVYLHRDIVDFRKSIDGLAIIVESEMKLSLFSEALFVFCNRKRDKLKVLYWDKTGFCLWYKRLENEKFKWPRKSDQNTISLTDQQWQWLLSGFDITQMKPHKKLDFEQETMY